MEMEKIIAAYGKNNHLSLGITTADSFWEEAAYLTAVQSQLSGFVSGDVARRIHPRLTMPQAKSIVVLAMPYAFGIEQKPPGLRGHISMAAVGTDYHQIMEAHLAGLAQRLLAKNPTAQILAYADTGPLAEGLVAARAGIGYIGKNRMVHTPEFGSMVFLGYLITDIPLRPTPKEKHSCGDCKRCIAACPTGALQEDTFELNLCRSYLTQKKGLLSYGEMGRMGMQIYGCDCCQLCCPHNQGVLTGGMEGYKPADCKSADCKSADCKSAGQYPALADLVGMDKAAFAAHYQHTAGGWRGRNALRKNAVIALGNSKNPLALPVLGKALQDKSPIIRQTAARALVVLGDRAGITALQEGLAQEKECVTKEILLEAIHRMKKEESHGVLAYKGASRQRPRGND